MDIIPDKRKVVSLVEQAHEGKICLPNFQRDFVWKRDEVADLVRSILRGYFIGSLLLLRCDPNQPPFAPVALRGARPLHRELHPELLVLDGQQRLSSLMYALTAPDLSLKDSKQRRWYFVNLDLLLSDPDDDEIVFDRTKRELKGLDTPEVQFAEHILPCTELLSSSSFLKWRDRFEDWLRQERPDELDEYRANWRDGWTDAATGFQTFEAPLVELPRVEESDGESIGRVCAIFEKLNSTGVDLSVYDLLTARLYRSGIRLHDLWSESCAEHKRLREWSNGSADHKKFGVLVLRTLALIRGLDPKPRILIDLKPDGFEEDWRRATAAMERALEMLELVETDGFGVFDQKWLPGYGLIPVLAAMRLEVDERRLGEKERGDLRRWYWCNVFMERYSSAVESKSRKDYAEMLAHWTSGGEEPEVLRQARFSIGGPGFSIRSSASYASAVYSGVFCMLAIRRARDWRRGENIQLQELQDHHIFPQAFLKRHGVTRKVDVNSIANRTLISNETNGKIKDKAPADYVMNGELIPEHRREELLEPHFINTGLLDMMRSTSEELSNEEAEVRYLDFVATREHAIITEIRDMCGTPEIPTTAAAALEQEDEVAADVLEEEMSQIEFFDEPVLGSV